MDSNTLYYASCAAGLEPVLLDEVDKLKETNIVSGSCLFGGAVFETMSSPQEVFQLRSADNIYAFLGNFKDIPLEKDAAMIYLVDLISKVNWTSALKLFHQWRGLFLECTESAPVSSGVQAMTFRVTCDRKCLKMKKHPFTSMDIAAALGEGVHKKFGWLGDMRGYNVEVMAWVRDAEILLVLALIYSERKADEIVSRQTDEVRAGTTRPPPRPSRSNSQLFSRRVYRQALVGTSLKPSIAFALLQLGRVKHGDILLDPMCGCGTIPLEAADWLNSHVMCIAGDLSQKAVAATETNTRGAGPCDVVQWDARRLPFRNNCIDRVICDMPYGVRCGSSHARESLYPKFIEEVVRMLKLGLGIAVLMAHGKGMCKAVAEQEPYLEVLQHIVIDMEGIQVDVYAVRRTMIAT